MIYLMSLYEGSPFVKTLAKNEYIGTPAVYAMVNELTNEVYIGCSKKHLSTTLPAHSRQQRQVSQ